MSASSVERGNRMKWREFIALIGEATAGPPVVELPQHAGWIQE